MRTETFDSDFPGRFGHNSPDGPVAEVLTDLADLVDRSQERPLFDLCRSLPGVDPVLDPDRHSHGPDAAAFAAEIDDDPTVLPHLDVLDGE